MINFKKFALSGLLTAAIAAPMVSQAQTVNHWVDRQLDKGRSHQQQDKNNWRNLGYAGAGVAGVGLLTHHPALVAIGITGGLYSAYRYEQDRKSQNSDDRRRHAYFSQKTRMIDGHRYHRVLVTRQGHQYY